MAPGMRKATGLVGQTLGPYRIERQLGRGGMGCVYLARAAEGDAVALKVMHPALAGDTKLVERFHREAEAGSRLEHPAILRTLGGGDAAGGYHYFALQFFRGVSVDVVVQGLGRLTEAQTLAIAYRAATALEYAHRLGVFHRDIKPSNLMISRTGAVVVSDFGLVHVVTDTRLTQTGSFLGTPAYCPPEQLRGKPIDGRTDLYALGVSMYEMLTGRCPFTGSTPFEVMEQILRGEARPLDRCCENLTPETGRLVEDLMERDQEARTTYATETVERLEHCLRAVVPPSEFGRNVEEAVRRVAATAYAQTPGLEPSSAGPGRPGDAIKTAGRPAARPRSGSGVVQIAGPRIQSHAVRGRRSAKSASEVSMAQPTPVPAVARTRAARPRLPLPSSKWLVRLAILAALGVGWYVGLHARILTPGLTRLMAVDDRRAIKTAQDGLRFLGVQAAPGLIAATERAQGPHRQRLFAALGQLQAPEATETLLAATTDGDPLVRAEAVRGLALLRDSETVRISLIALEDPDPRVRLAAVQGLRPREPRFVRPLVQAYIGADADLREALTRELRSYGADALPQLNVVWRRLDQNGKRAVVTCVEGIGGAPAVEFLVGKLVERQPAVRFFVVEALQRLTGAGIGDDPGAWRAWATAHAGELS